MAKYKVSLGTIGLTREVVLEAANPLQSLSNLLAMIEEHHVVVMPREDKPESFWTAQNTEKAKDELVVKDTASARKILSQVRKDVLDVFWFVNVEEG